MVLLVTLPYPQVLLRRRVPGAGLINNNGLNENNANPPNVEQSKISGILSPSLQQPQTAIAKLHEFSQIGPDIYTLFQSKYWQGGKSRRLFGLP